jgi:hypothetical protein
MISCLFHHHFCMVWPGAAAFPRSLTGHHFSLKGGRDAAAPRLKPVLVFGPWQTGLGR